METEKDGCDKPNAAQNEDDKMPETSRKAEEQPSSFGPWMVAQR